jgi:hypothetical protein
MMSDRCKLKIIGLPPLEKNHVSVAGKKRDARQMSSEDMRMLWKSFVLSQKRLALPVQTVSYTLSSTPRRSCS